MAVPGYYPDPWEPQQLRWWDGTAWTPHVSAPVAPAVAPQPAFAAPDGSRPRAASPSVAPPAPGWAAGPAVPTATFVTPSYVVTGHGSRVRAAGDRPVWLVPVAAVSAVAVLLLAVFTWSTAHNRRDAALAAAATASHGASPAASTTGPAAATSAGASSDASSSVFDNAIIDGTAHGTVRAPLTAPHGTELVTPADARAVMQSFWPQHETAVANDDLVGMAALTTGAARLYEVGGRACGCWSQTQTRTLVAAAYYVRHQSRYPIDFLVEAQSTRSGAVNRWTDMYVFTKQGPGKPWLLALHSGYAPMDDAEPKMMEPTVDSDGYLSGPAPGDAARIAATAAALPGSLAALWQRTKDTGAIPAHPDLVAQGINQTRLEQIAAHKQGRRQANGAYGAYRFWVSGSDPLFTYALDDGSAVVCRAVRETVRYTSPPGTLMVQRTAYQSWGYPLGPGSYPRLTTTGAWQTCWVTTAFPGQPSFLIDTEGMGGSTVAG